jgi:class 3 adenylate cyclase
MSRKNTVINRKTIAKTLAAAASLLILATAAAGSEPARTGALAFGKGSGSIYLAGEWEKYDGVFTDEGIASTMARPEFVHAETRLGFPTARDSGGAATYRLRVELSDGAGMPRRLVLLMAGAAGVDGVLVNGSPLYDRAADGAPPLAMPFDAPDGRVSIVLQCGRDGLRLERPSLLPAVIALARQDSLGGLILAWAVPLAAEAAFFLIVGVVLLCLFLAWRKTREFLTLAAAMLVSGAALAFAGCAVLGVLPAGFLDRPRLEAAVAAAAICALAAYAAFFASALRDRLPTPAAAAFIAALAAAAAAAIAVPSIAGLVAAAAAAVAALAFLGLLALSLVLAARGQSRGRLIGAALLVLGASVAAARLLAFSFASAYLVLPAGLAAFGLALLLLLLVKSGNTLDTVESLSDYVESISRTVKSFIPREFLDNLQKSDVTDLRLGDHARKKMTIFFSDIRSFTELSENLTVEENFAFINSYLSRVVPVIRENGGFVDKYIGDAIMALFGGEGGADRAIKSAIAMNAKMVEYNGHRAKMGYRPISMGVGVHTGDLMLGVVGVSDRMENTVISDAVNLGSRLQAITKAFNVSLAISEQAFKELEDPGVYKYRFIGKVKVKGKAEPLSVFEIFDGIAPELFERKMKANMFFEQGMLCYYQKDFQGAMYYFKRVLDIIPEDGASEFYLENCMNKATL